MTGEIYSIPTSDEAGSEHLHVVVVELAKECWVVQGFGKGGYLIGQRIAAYGKMGFQEDQAVVELDNEKHINFRGSYTGKIAYWEVARPLKLSKRIIRRYKCIGKMDKAGIVQLANGLLSLAEAKPEVISPNLRKKLRKLVT